MRARCDTPPTAAFLSLAVALGFVLLVCEGSMAWVSAWSNQLPQVRTSMRRGGWHEYVKLAENRIETSTLRKRYMCKRRQTTPAFASTTSNDCDTTNDNNQIYASKLQQLNDATRLSLAPMMEYTDRHFRCLMRLISQRTLLYSEMIAANAICHHALPYNNNDNDSNNHEKVQLRRFLSQGPIHPEGPSVLQLGGSNLQQLHQASQLIHTLSQTSSFPMNYTALNLNCGCPSPKVATVSSSQSCFGVALMHNPNLVRDLCRAMAEGCGYTMPITVKCRLGTDVVPEHTHDDQALYQNLCQFIETIASDGVVTHFDIHARIALGLSETSKKSYSPKDNRSIPPLRYDLVRRLAQVDFPQLSFSLNGGLDTIWDVQRELDQCREIKGIMVGRGMAADPWGFSYADEVIFGLNQNNDKSLDCRPRNRWEVLEQYLAHADAEEAMSKSTWVGINGKPYQNLVRRPVLKAIKGLFAGEPHAKTFRVALDAIAARKGSGGEKEDGAPLSTLVLDAAQQCLSEEVLYRSRKESFERELELRRDHSQGSVKGGSSTRADGGEEAEGNTIVTGATRSTAVQEWQSMRQEEAEAIVGEDGAIKTAPGPVLQQKKKSRDPCSIKQT